MARPLAAEREAWAGLDRLGEVEVHEFTAPEQVPARAEGASVLITNKAPIGPTTIDAANTLQFITVTATGYDCVDVAAARRRGIPVSNVPEYSTDSVAQFVFALLLELCHHVARHDESVRAGEWTRQPDFSLRKSPLIELAGKTMGVVGYGRIGRRVGELAEAFGMSVVAFSPSRRSPDGARPVAWCDLDELFERSDVISLHCPLTPQNVGLVNRERLSQLRPGAFLINTATRPADRRGGSRRGTRGRQVGGRRPGRRLGRADQAREPAADGTPVPDHAAHRLGDRRGSEATHGGDRGQRRRLPPGPTDPCGELTSEIRPEPDAPASAFRWGSSIHSLALGAAGARSERESLRSRRLGRPARRFIEFR